MRHVQSGLQRGFSRLDEAVRFIEGYTVAPSRGRDKPRAARPAFPLAWLPTRRLQFAWAAAGLVVLAVVVLLLVSPNVSPPLAGAAAGGGIAGDVLLTFVAGVAVGAVAVWAVIRFKSP